MLRVQNYLPSTRYTTHESRSFSLLFSLLESILFTTPYFHDLYIFSPLNSVGTPRRPAINRSIQHSLMRRTSVSLPTRNVAHDPHEKPARYSTKGASDSAASTLEKIKTAWMTQSQRSRYLKTGGILLFIVFLFYYLSPNGIAPADGMAKESPLAYAYG